MIRRSRIVVVTAPPVSTIATAAARHRARVLAAAPGETGIDIAFAGDVP